MKSRLYVLLAICLAVLTGCSQPNPRLTAFETLKGQGNYRLVASATIGVDRIDFWQETKESDGSPFGRFLMAAVAQSGDFLDFRSGEFVSSSRPFFQSPRYIALVASIALGKEREVFFVYDSQSKTFLTHSVDAFVPHVHENIVIVGDFAFFASCKTPTPVGRLNLMTGQVTMYGDAAPQSASFHILGSDVLVKGTDNRMYRVDEKGLLQVETLPTEGHIVEMTFDTILKNKKEANKQIQPIAGKPGSG